VIGRDFAYELLAPVAARSDAELADALGRLTDAGLVFQRGAAATATYLFKHALVRDAAYSTLLRSRRQQLHTAVAAALEADFPDTVEAQPELLAHHFTEAGLIDQGVGYWQRAGERAVARSANLEAIAHLNRGIEVLKTLPESATRDEQELALQVALIGALSTGRGHGSAEVELPAARALELSRRIAADTPAQFWAMFWLAMFYLVRGALPLARELAEEVLGAAGRRQEAELLAYGHFDLGLTLLFSGEWPDARVHTEQAITLYDREWGRPATFRAGLNCLAVSYSNLGRILWHLGYPDRALRSSRQAVAEAEGLSHPFTLTVAFQWAAVLHQLRREAVPALNAAETTLALAAEHGFPFLGAHAMAVRGWALVQQDCHGEGIDVIRQGTDADHRTGADLEDSHWLALLAEACGKAGRPEEGLRAVAEALAHGAKTGAVYYQAELHRLEGELRLDRDPADALAAEASFRRAIEIACRQQAKSWELRAATSLARLWRDQGRRAEARELIAPVYGWFTEGFDTADLKEAKALLADLAKAPVRSGQPVR
jgi:predicted ATPase